MDGTSPQTETIEHVQAQLSLSERAGEIYRQQIQYMQEQMQNLRTLIQDKENIIDNLILRYDLGDIPASQDNETLDAEDLDLQELRRKAEALAQRTMLENFELREMLTELRDENFHYRNEIYEQQDRINRLALERTEAERVRAAEQTQLFELNNGPTQQTTLTRAVDGSIEIAAFNAPTIRRMGTAEMIDAAIQQSIEAANVVEYEPTSGSPLARRGSFTSVDSVLSISDPMTPRPARETTRVSRRRSSNPIPDLFSNDSGLSSTSTTGSPPTGIISMPSPPNEQQVPPWMRTDSVFSLEEPTERQAEAAQQTFLRQALVARAHILASNRSQVEIHRRRLSNDLEQRLQRRPSITDMIDRGILPGPELEIHRRRPSNDLVRRRRRHSSLDADVIARGVIPQEREQRNRRRSISEELEQYLQRRPSISDLVNRHIMTNPEPERVHRRRISPDIEQYLRRRPSQNELEQRGIVPPGYFQNMAPTPQHQRRRTAEENELHSHRRQLSADIEQRLNRRLSITDLSVEDISRQLEPHVSYPLGQFGGQFPFGQGFQMYSQLMGGGRNLPNGSRPPDGLIHPSYFNQQTNLRERSSPTLTEPSSLSELHDEDDDFEVRHRHRRSSSPIALIRRRSQEFRARDEVSTRLQRRLSNRMTPFEHFQNPYARTNGNQISPIPSPIGLMNPFAFQFGTNRQESPRVAMQPGTPPEVIMQEIRQQLAMMDGDMTPYQRQMILELEAAMRGQANASADTESVDSDDEARFKSQPDEAIESREEQKEQDEPKLRKKLFREIGLELVQRVRHLEHQTTAYQKEIADLRRELEAHEYAFESNEIDQKMSVKFPIGLSRAVSDPGRIQLAELDEKEVVEVLGLRRASESAVLSTAMDVSQTQLEDMVCHLRDSWQSMPDSVGTSYFQVRIVGCQKGLLETPSHFFLNNDVAVGAVRARLAMRYNVAPSSIRLLFGGSYLESEKTLGQYGVEEDSHLVVVFRDCDDEKKDEPPPPPQSDPVQELERLASHREEEVVTNVAESTEHVQAVLANDIYGLSIEVRSRHHVDTWNKCMVMNASSDKLGIEIRYLEGRREGDTRWISLEYETRFRSGVAGAIRAKLDNQIVESDAFGTFARIVTSEPCMITQEADDEDPRFQMPCGHPITAESLHQYVAHQSGSEKATGVSCPFIINDGNKCDASWSWPLIRYIANMDKKERRRCELQLSYNQVESTLNAQQCARCGFILYRENEEGGAKTQCINCNKTSANKELHFCWMCRTAYPIDAEFCPNENCVSNVTKNLIEILKTCPKKAIGPQENVPSIRACVNCGQLIHHTEACKHMQCYMCKTYFCFVCLTPFNKETDSWQCGSYSSACPNGVQPPQEVEVTALATRVRLDIAAEDEREKRLRAEWAVTSTIEFMREIDAVRVWKIGVVLFLADDSSTLIVQESGCPNSVVSFVDRFSDDVRPWLILRDEEVG